MLNPNDSRRLARALLKSDLSPRDRMRAATAADQATKWSDLPEWVQQLETKETTA